MAAGVPAVAYAIPPIIEIDRGLGVLEIVPVRDVAALARALLELASSTERRRAIGEKGKAHVVCHYQSQTNMAEAMHRLNLVAERVAKTASLHAAAALQNARQI
jgi:glycosyltransferase involved in cell wall biosynthesis